MQSEYLEYEKLLKDSGAVEDDGFDDSEAEFEVEDVNKAKPPKNPADAARGLRASKIARWRINLTALSQRYNVRGPIASAWVLSCTH